MRSATYCTHICCLCIQVSGYNFGSYSLDAHGSADGAGNVDAIGVQLPASCWAKAPGPPQETQPNPWIKEAPPKAPLGSAAAQWGRRCVLTRKKQLGARVSCHLLCGFSVACFSLADSVLGFASVNFGGPLFIAPGSGTLRGPKQKTKLNPFGFQK